MGVGKGFFWRFIAASIGLFGAVAAQAFPLPRIGLSVPTTNDWSDPADPAARYGIASFAATIYIPSVERPFITPDERLAYELKIKALGGLSERVQAVIDCLGFVATDILERYEIAEGTAGEKLATLRNAIEDHGNLAHQHTPAAGVEAAEAADGVDDDTLQSPETVQEAQNAVTGLKQYVEVQQQMLNSLENAIGDIHAMDVATVSDEALGDAMDTLRELVSYWQMPARASRSGDADTTVPVSISK
jgi:hypothetical protein